VAATRAAGARRETAPGPASGVAETIGVVLAGGASRRMGRDKAAMAMAGETLAARAARLLLGLCPSVVLADGGRGLLPDLPSLPDAPGQGPAAGILGAARAWPGHPLLVLACDLPRVPAALLAELLREGGDVREADARAAAVPDWVVPRWERGLEPLCALYRPAALAALAAAVERGVMAPHRLADTAGLAIRFLEGEGLRRFGPPAEIFLNLNTQHDFERWQRIESLP
jgi:molybdopterin-guanine dinucleotide biosynthesis protein A